MTKNQSKAHWWIVENHPGFEVKPPSKYIEICDIVFDALKQGQSLPTDSVVKQSEQYCECEKPTLGKSVSRCGTCDEWFKPLK